MASALKALFEDVGFTSLCQALKRMRLLLTSRYRSKIGCNFFGFDDEGCHLGCDWDYDDLTARIEVAGVTTLSDFCEAISSVIHFDILVIPQAELLPVSRWNH